ncbi:MAG: flagellar basal body-associated FliL family protein [Planctomycetes bacterium]|nr:flagellar basal body-associated FliL family protein [Planctomycetota bacterium]
MVTDTLPDLTGELPPLDEPSDGPAGGGGLKRTLLIVAAAMVVTASATTLIVSQGAPAQPKPDPAEDIHVVDAVEAEIGTFNCSNNLPDGSVLHVSFNLFATVAEGRQPAFKEAVMIRRNARVRQAVSKVIRSASLDELEDAEHNVIKRQLKEEINKVLQKSYINEVIVVDFRMLQQ